MSLLKEISDYIISIFSYDSKNPLIFTQFNFWVFFAFVMAVMSFIHNKKLLRNTFLFFASLFFYYQTSGMYVLLLIFAVTSDYFIGKKINNTENESKRKGLVTLSVIINLSVLGFFKYAYFFTDTFNKIFHTKHQVFNHFAHWSNGFFHSNFDVDKIILPVGVSFFTFQTISYSIDVYRRKIKPVTNVFDYGFYVSFFPQLVAGPIVRANEFIPQIYNKYFLSKKVFGLAIFWILNGMAKKLILGDYLAVNFIDRVFDNPLLYSGFENVLALLGYSLQVYADFSGYTDIAVGVALLMGFKLPINFNSPYKATNPGEFWKRWHISLSTWLKDYLYIPLGGNRKASFGSYFWITILGLVVILLSHNVWVNISIIGLYLSLFIIAYFSPKARMTINTNINLMVTMLIGGIWHGASWNFMIWGGLNGLGIVVYKHWRKLTHSQQFILLGSLFVGFYILHNQFSIPIINIITYWLGMMAIVAMLYWFLKKYFQSIDISKFKYVWGIFLTFLFITFTRVFFRAGSNLDPAEANIEAWNTASNIVHQVGSKWNFKIIDDIVIQYYNIVLIFIFGMIIHWLPIRTKKWYKLNFILMPKAVQLMVVILSIFVFYQFVTADLQTFIYFQF